MRKNEVSVKDFSIAEFLNGSVAGQNEKCKQNYTNNLLSKSHHACLLLFVTPIFLAVRLSFILPRHRFYAVTCISSSIHRSKLVIRFCTGLILSSLQIA